MRLRDCEIANDFAHLFIRLFACLCLGLFLVACQNSPTAKNVTLKVDGQSRSLTTEATTVRELLAEAKVTLSNLDHVKPDLYTTLDDGLTIIITRVTEEVVVRHEIIPFDQQIVTNEALAPNETRLAQLGVNGEEAISVRLVFENGVQVSQTEISRQVVTPAVPEIMVIGPVRELPPVAFEGTISYLSNDRAWLMRDNTNNRRILANGSQFDGHVFELSPDGRYLLYTQPISNQIDLPLNELWLASTTIVGEEPQPLKLTGVLHAAWSPIISPALIAYSTAERTVSAPGWKAHNDLWLFNPLAKSAKPLAILPPNTEGLYAWWGSHFVWSPDGQRLAYARPDQIGIITFTVQSPLTYNITPLFTFTPFETLSEWAWTPSLSWSPDGQFIAATVHGRPVATESAAESQQFDLWLLQVDDTLRVKIAPQVGMWANPVWGQWGIAFGEALEPFQSVNSRYKIQVIDRDGSNKKQLFPFQSEPGVRLPELQWSADGQELLFVYNGNLYQTSYNGAPPTQLTLDSQINHLRWVAQKPTLPVTVTAIFTATPALTVTATVTRARK